MYRFSNHTAGCGCVQASPAQIQEALLGLREEAKSKDKQERQKVRCRRLRSGPEGRECWRALGFTGLPSAALDPKTLSLKPQAPNS